MSNSREIKDFHHSKFNSPSSEDCRYPETPTSSKRLKKHSHRINTRERRNKRNVDSMRVNRSRSSSYETPGFEKTYTRRESAASPVVKVTSVEVIKSWSKNCGLRRKDKEKLGRESSSNRSSSSGTLERQKVSRGPTPSQKLKIHNQKIIKSEVDSCGYCNCNDYLKTGRLNLLQDSKRHAKSRGTITPHPSTCCPQGSPTPTQKLCRMLKTREAKRIIGCTCIHDGWNPSCSIECTCPETPVDIPGKTLSKVSKKSTLSNNNAKEDNQSRSSCSCSSPDRSPIPKINIQDLQPTVVPPSDWKKSGEYLKKISDEYRLLSSDLNSLRREIEAVKKPGEVFRRRITRRYPGKEFSFEVRSIGDDSQKKNRSHRELERVDRSCQCSNSEDVPEGIKTVHQKFRRSELSDLHRCQERPNFLESHQRSNYKNDVMRRRESRRPHGFTCNTTYCTCKPDANVRGKSVAEDLAEIEKERRHFDRQKSRKNKPKRQIRRYDFSLPRIVALNKGGRDRDESRMMIYPSKDQVGCPLTLYKSGSFIDCSVKHVDDVGLKYDVSYVQRYVSRPWQPAEYSEVDGTSHCLSTDGYG